MAEITLTATPRPPQGTRPARRLRNEGKIPGVVYGMGADPVPLTVEWRELRAALVTEQGLNAVIHLQVDGDRTPTLVKEIQRHPVRRNVLHVDFIRVDLNKPVDVDVPIHLEGEAEAVSREGGVIDQILTSLAIQAKPSDIPAGLTVDITDLEIGGAKHVSDIALPEGVTTSVDPEETVVTASFQAVEVEEPAEGEEAVEGEERRGRGRRGRGRRRRRGRWRRRRQRRGRGLTADTRRSTAASAVRWARGRRLAACSVARRVSRRSGGAPRLTCSWSAWPTPGGVRGHAPQRGRRGGRAARRAARRQAPEGTRSAPWSTRSPSADAASRSPSR